jgi:ClpP class serine protease
MGEDALRHRLVDEIGGLEAAIAEARRRAGIATGEKIRIVEYRRPRPAFFENALGSMLGSLWQRTFRLPDFEATYYLSDDALGD